MFKRLLPALGVAIFTGLLYYQILFVYSAQESAPGFGYAHLFGIWFLSVLWTVCMAELCREKEPYKEWVDPL